jgi:hypothetical protein
VVLEQVQYLPVHSAFRVLLVQCRMVLVNVGVMTAEQDPNQIQTNQIANCAILEHIQMTQDNVKNASLELCQHLMDLLNVFNVHVVQNPTLTLQIVMIVLQDIILQMAYVPNVRLVQHLLDMDIVRVLNVVQVLKQILCNLDVTYVSQDFILMVLDNVSNVLLELFQQMLVH